MTSTESRQVSASFDRAFQNLFTLVGEVVALYRQNQAIDGSAVVDPRLQEVPPHLVEENLKSYKECFDSTGAEIHVDVVLELYTKVRSFVQRGYQCDSWLRGPEAAIYYGASRTEAGTRIVNLDCVFLMLEALKRSDTQFRTQSAVLRIKFAHQLYTIFMTALNYAKVVENETNVRGVTPAVCILDDVKVLEGIHSEILGDLPKPVERSAPGPGAGAGGNPLAGLASMFPGGLTDVVGSLLQTLPSLTRTVTDTVSRTTGTTISESDQQMIDSTMRNITGLLGNPDGMRSMLADLGSGSDGVSRFIERILAPGQQQAAGAPPIEAPSKPQPPALD